MPSWTAARKYGIPAGLNSIPAVNPTDDPNTYGSQWQRFVNTIAIELDTLSQALNDGILEYYLQTPGYNHKSLDITYRNMMPDNTTGVLSVWANLEAKTISGEVSSNGPILDPNRSPDLSLLPVTRLFDFVYGISQIYTVTLPIGTTQFVLPNRVGINEDGSQQIEWVTVNGIQTNSYVLAADQKTITIEFLQPMGSILQPTAGFSQATTLDSPTTLNGSEVSVHFTTYDVYYVLQEDLPVLYLRSNYYEIMVASSGTAIPTTGPLTNPVFPQGTSALIPLLHMIWNELDEIGLYLNKPRRLNENNSIYLGRLLDSIYYPPDSTTTGLRNALATEFGLVTHYTWGPTGDYNSGTIYLGGSIDPTSIQVNNLPLDYYSVSAITGQTGTIPLTVPSLLIGQTVQVSYSFIASGNVIPRAVPYSFSTTLPASGTPIYDQIVVGLPRTRYTIEDISTPSRDAWYPGSLCLWKNGVSLEPGVDFQELSSTIFTLTNLPNPGDFLQLGYIYENADDPPELESQSDVLTDLAPIIRIGATFSVGPVPAAAATGEVISNISSSSIGPDGEILSSSPSVASGALPTNTVQTTLPGFSETNSGIIGNVTTFPGYLTTPPNIDPATLPSGATWTITFTVSNAGSATSSGFDIIIKSPPIITFDGTYLTSSDVSMNRSLSYIDTNQVSINNLTDAQYNTKLYNPDGSGTILLHEVAALVQAQDPLEWGSVSWDTGIWHLANEPASEFGYVPNLFDPTYTLNQTPIFGAFALGDPTSPGSVISNSNLVRYTQFQSGIGDGEDNTLSITSNSDLTSYIAIGQGSLSGTEASISAPYSSDDQWWVSLQPGAYFLNQELHQLFANPTTLEAYSFTAFLSDCPQFAPIVAKVYSNGVWIPLRRTSYIGTNGLPSLQLNEEIVGSGQSVLILQKGNLNNIGCVADDGNIYTVPASTNNNQITCSPALPQGVTLTVSYTLANSYLVNYLETGTELVFDQAYSGGVIITYESGGNTNFISGYPLHPYYNPKNNGFVYLKSCTQIPANLDVRVDPIQCISGGNEEVTVYVTLTDADGAACEGYNVTVVIAYPNMPVTYQLTTDIFGCAQQRVPSSTTAHLLKITASMVLYSSTNSAQITLIDHTNLECFAPFV